MSSCLAESILCCAVLSPSSRVQLFVTPWAAAHQAPLSTGFSRQEYWSGLPGPSPGDLPHPRIKSATLPSPALADRFFTTSTTWEASVCLITDSYYYIKQSRLFPDCLKSFYYTKWNPLPETLWLESLFMGLKRCLLLLRIFITIILLYGLRTVRHTFEKQQY